MSSSSSSSPGSVCPSGSLRMASSMSRQSTSSRVLFGSQAFANPGDVYHRDATRGSRAQDFCCHSSSVSRKIRLHFACASGSSDTAAHVAHRWTTRFIIFGSCLRITMRDVRRFVSAWRGHPVELRDLLGIVGETLVIRMSWPRSPTVGAAPGKQPAQFACM